MDRCVCCRKSVMYVSFQSVWDWPTICGDCIEKYPLVLHAVDKVHTAISILEEAVEPIREAARKSKTGEKT